MLSFFLSSEFREEKKGRFLFRRQQLRSSCHGLELDLTHRSSFVASPLVCFQCSVVLDRFFFLQKKPDAFFFSPSNIRSLALLQSALLCVRQFVQVLNFL
jgi:hypothetical protein